MKKMLKSLLGWIVYLAVLIALIYGTPKGLAYFLETDYPMAAITSKSMWPALKKGDIVFIKGVAGKEEVKEGDIVVYKNPKGFTIHRIIKVNEDTVITKGDANNTPDAPVRYEEIVGKTLTLNQKPLRIPMLGNISILLNKNQVNAR